MGCGQQDCVPLYSRKLHIRVRRDSTSAVTSLTILALSLGPSVVNHFASRCGAEDVVSELLLAAAARWECRRNLPPCPAATRG
jgi:hypothetical protein